MKSKLSKKEYKQDMVRRRISNAQAQENIVIDEWQFQDELNCNKFDLYNWGDYTYPASRPRICELDWESN